MSKTILTNKTHVMQRADYVQLPLLCPICKKLKNHSKKFRSPYALQYHLTNYHSLEDEIQSEISVSSVRKIISVIVEAYQKGMLLI